MSPLKLNGSTSGFVALDAPAAAGSNTLVLPTGNGSANQLLKNSTTAGTLAFSSMVETTTGVGIGTTSPSALLHIVRSDSEAQRISASGANQGIWTSFTAGSPNVADLKVGVDGAAGGSYVGGSSAFVWNVGNSPLAFGTNNTERMRILNDGNVLIGKTSSNIATDGVELFPQAAGGTGLLRVSNSNLCVRVNRTVTDGALIAFLQDGTEEGNISVSGTTVSYNGAHLSRWSQLPSGAEREEILRGSVLSNIDEMCEWGDEDNEQLNRMKVSDVEGDKNVSGVFQAWDDDDNTYVNDFYCAMTGDFIIRIAEGVTVERGDLLMSAGDGTAKPQDDDIIRSKTIAKVTSTHVTCTYDDGSYCVPCVLMAC